MPSVTAFRFRLDPRLHGLISWFKRRRPEVYAHGERVASWMEGLAKTMGVPAAERERWQLGGLLHDLGKVWVPEALLAARRPLTHEERRVLNGHVEAGAHLLKTRLPASLAEALVPFALWHHERYDGRGYPQGLSGQEIPFEVALLSVADAFTAMCERRPYADARAEWEALKELDAGAGKQFHPRAVELFFKTLGTTPRPRVATLVG